MFNVRSNVKSKLTDPRHCEETRSVNVAISNSYCHSEPKAKNPDTVMRSFAIAQDNLCIRLSRILLGTTSSYFHSARNDMNKFFKQNAFVFRKTFVLLFCLKMLFLDTLSLLPVKAEDEGDKTAFDLITTESLPISVLTTNTPSAITLGSLPVSFNLSSYANAIQLASKPVSYNTSLLPSNITLTSLPVSYSINALTSEIKLSSLPISYALSAFSGENLKLSSSPVSYRIYNSVPVLELISPNLLPISENMSLDVTLKGDNFVNGSIASIGTLKIQTMYISQNELIATVPDNFLNMQNSFEVFVSNPPPQGGVSMGFNIRVVEPIPTAKLNIYPEIGVAPQIVTFDATGSEDILAKYYGQELSYSWDLGETENTENNNPIITKTFTVPGKYTVMLNVINSQGKTSSLSKEIEIREKNDAPDGTFTVNANSGDIPLSVSFTSMVSDNESDPISCLWDFGDGKISNENNPTHLYEVPGIYNPKLTVSDTLGSKTTIASVKVIVLPKNNLPKVQIAAIPEKSTLKQNIEGLFTSKIQFISAGSFDPDGEELSYSWDFGDGENSSEPEPIHEYKNAGEYTVMLTLNDSRNGSSTKEETIQVLKPLPQAVAEVSSFSGNAPFTVNLNGALSHDYDGMPVNLSWDFGDGQTQNVISTEGMIEHTYADAGVYNLSLLAQAADGRSSKASLGNIIVNPGDGSVSGIIKLEGEEKGLPNKSMVKLAAAIDSIENQLNYKWSWSARTWDLNGNLINISDEINNTLTNNGQNNEVISMDTFEYSFTMVGQFTPVLEVEKVDGSKTKFYGETFTILPEQGPVATANITSDKTDGNVGLEVSFDASNSYDPKPNGSIMNLIWNFGDNETSTEIAPKHTYNTEGTYTPTLIVYDSEGNIGFAQTNSIKIYKENTSQNQLSRTFALQVTGEENPQAEASQEEINELINSMIAEAANKTIITDNEKPEIGPVSLLPKTVKAGEVIKLSCFVKDNLAVSNLGYILANQENTILKEEIIDLKNVEQNNESYIEHEIKLPVDMLPGSYKIKLTATDINGNQIAKSNSQEEIIASFEVIASRDVAQNISTQKNMIEPSETKILSEEETSQINPTTRITNTRTRSLNRIDSSTESEVSKELIEIEKLFVRGRCHSESHSLRSAQAPTKNLDNVMRSFAIAQDDTFTHSVENGKKSHIRHQVIDFNISMLSQVNNPFRPTTVTATNTLTLNVLSQSNGYIEIGTKGSLTANNYIYWVGTNVYVDGRKTGNISWLNATGISYTTSEPVGKIVEFRPTNGSGNELPSNTWASSYITFGSQAKPEITSTSYTEWTVGRGAFDLYIYGKNFNQNSRVYFDGNKLTPYASGSNLIIVRIPANLVNYIGIKSVLVRNSTEDSNTVSFAVKANQNNPCNLSMSLPQTYWGAESTTILSGNNTYLSSPYSAIQGNGSVTIPFCLDGNYEVKTSINVSHIKSNSGPCNNLFFWVDDRFVGGNIVCNNSNLSYDNLNVSNLEKGLHSLKVSFDGLEQDKLLVGEAMFSNNGSPILEAINPNIVSLEGENRLLTLLGKGFNQNTNVIFDGQNVSKLSFDSTMIVIGLPAMFASAGTKTIYLTENNKESTRLSLTVRDKVEIINSSFKVNPIQPFPGSTFNISLQAKDKSNESLNPNYIAYIAIFDPDGKILNISGLSSSLATVTLPGFIQSTQGINQNEKTINFDGTIPLPMSIKAGNYNAIVCIERRSAIGSDYSDLETYKYLLAQFLGLTRNENLIPVSHKLIFTPKPAVNSLFGIEENSSENVGFVQTANKIIQDGQSIKFKTIISNGTEYLSNLKFNFKSGNGEETGITTADNASFAYTNTNDIASTPLTFNPKVDIYWVEGNFQTKVNTLNGPTVLVYPDYSPLAKARVNTEQYPTYADKAPLITGFIDTGSFDPNQRFSSSIDFVNPQDNEWQLFSKSGSQDAIPASLPQDGKISDDKKSFISGSLFNPGTYFAKLTVKDMTGKTDSAYTESVTVTQPGQMVVVFATTEPQDKKIFTQTGSSTSIIPVQFKSRVTVLGGMPDLSYKWDFGDGSCIANNQPLPMDCTDPNPTHNYFDGGRSFGGQQLTHRRYATPQLAVTARFPNSQKTEKWQASAGTLTFYTEPHFVLLDISPDTVSGIVPLTVSFMIDRNTAMAVDATVNKYEIDFGDNSPVESGQLASLEELLNKTFTHVYLSAGVYSPKLKIWINESERVFIFSLGDITTAGTGVSEGNISSFTDGLTIEKNQGDLLDLEKEVLMSTQLLKSFRWQNTNDLNKIHGQGIFNSKNSVDNKILIGYETLPGTYMLKLTQNTDGINTEKNYTLIIKDQISPVVENLTLDSGEIIAANDTFSFHIEVSDNANLMSLNWSLINKSDGSIAFTGHEGLENSNEIKDLSFTVPEELKGEYKLLVEVIDSAGNKTTSEENINTDITILDKSFSEQADDIDIELSNQVVETAAGLGAAGTLLSGIATLVGLNGIKNFLSGLIHGESFNEKLTNEMKDFGNDYIGEVDMILCYETSRLSKKLAMLSDLISNENTLAASKIILHEANKTNVLLSHFEDELKPGGKFETLNSLAANVTAVNTDDGLELKTGGNRTNEFMNSFYVPELINTTKRTLNSIATTRAHGALSILLNGKDLNTAFNVTAFNILNSDDELHKLLTNGYRRIEKSNDEPTDLIRAFIKGDFSTISINKLSDFKESQQKEKEIIIAYTQRLLQDLGISGPTNGAFTQNQYAEIINLTGKDGDNLTGEDLKKIKNLASKARSIVIGIRNKELLVTTNRDGGYNTFIGTLIGKLASSTPSNSTLTLKEIIQKVKMGNDLETVNLVLSSQVDEDTLNKISKELLNKTITLISYLSNGDRRKIAVTNLIPITERLRTYAEEKSYSIALDNLKTAEGIIKTYPIVETNEDNIGLLANKRIAKLNLLKDKLIEEDIKLNNYYITSKVKTGISHKLLKEIILKSGLLTPALTQNALAFGSIEIRQGYAHFLNDEVEKMDEIDLTYAGRSNSLVRKAFSKLLLAEDIKEISKAITQLRHLAVKATKYYDYNKQIFSILETDVKDIAPNRIETEVVDYVTNEIEKRLSPADPSNTQVPQDLIVTIDKNFANTKIQTRTLKQIIKDVFLNTYKNKIFIVDGIECSVNSAFNFDWIQEIDETVDTKTNTKAILYDLNTDEIQDKNLIIEFQNLTDLQKQELVEQELISSETLFDSVKLYGSANKCGRVNEPNLGVNNVNKGAAIINTSVIGVDNLPTELSFSLTVEATETIDEINGVVNIINSETGETIISKSFSRPGSVAKGTKLTIDSFKITGTELKEILTKLSEYAAKSGKTLQELLPKLLQQVEIHGVKLLGNAIKDNIPMWILIESLLPKPLQDGPEPTIVSLPQARCVVNKEIIQSNEKVNVFYSTYNANKVSVSVTPGKTNTKAPKIGSFDLRPVNDTNISITATNEVGSVSAECKIDVDDKKPAEITGLAEHQFFYGKDENNLDKAWDYPVRFRIDGMDTGFDYATGRTARVRVLPGTHNTSIVVNNVETIMNSITVNEGDIKEVSHHGGVFRHYGTRNTIIKIVESKRILDSGEGDIQTILNPLGSGAYLTNLSITPTIETERTIAELLRLYKLNTFEPGNPNSKGELESEKARAYVDITVNTNAEYLDSSVLFPLQFIKSNSFLDFGFSGENFHSIFISKFGLVGSQ